jgi:hypothetical protein
MTDKLDILIDWLEEQITNYGSQDNVEAARLAHAYRGVRAQAFAIRNGDEPELNLPSLETLRKKYLGPS